MDLTEAIDGVVAGTLDAQENPLANTATYGVHKYHRYHTLSGHFYLSRGLWANRDAVDGWPEEGKEWLDTGTVSERLRFIQNFMMEDTDVLKDVDYGDSGDDNISDPGALISDRLIVAQRTDPDAIIDYFLSIIFPGLNYYQ